MTIIKPAKDRKSGARQSPERRKVSRNTSDFQAKKQGPRANVDEDAPGPPRACSARSCSPKSDIRPKGRQPVDGTAQLEKQQGKVDTLPMVMLAQPWGEGLLAGIVRERPVRPEPHRPTTTAESSEAGDTMLNLDRSQ